MCMTNSMIKQQTQHAAYKNVHHAYIVNEQGQEVQITTTMIRSACHDLLKQCRTVKS